MRHETQSVCPTVTDTAVAVKLRREPEPHRVLTQSLFCAPSNDSLTTKNNKWHHHDIINDIISRHKTINDTISRHKTINDTIST